MEAFQGLDGAFINTDSPTDPIIDTAVWSKGMRLMAKFNCIPNCLALLPVLSMNIKCWHFL